jgi:hypothetical protein
MRLWKYIFYRERNNNEGKFSGFHRRRRNLFNDRYSPEEL